MYLALADGPPLLLWGSSHGISTLTVLARPIVCNRIASPTATYIAAGLTPLPSAEERFSWQHFSFILKYQVWQHYEVIIHIPFSHENNQPSHLIQFEIWLIKNDWSITLAANTTQLGKKEGSDIWPNTVLIRMSYSIPSRPFK